jgi:peptide-methionine (S)-S-oxide reductase
MRRALFATFLLLFGLVLAFVGRSLPALQTGKDDRPMEIATFGAGCFWGVEAAFRGLPNVTATRVGYAGGHVPNPTYEEVCSGTTGHTEVVEVTYDPETVSYDDLLDVFWKRHDPTAKRKAQYRSAIFYHSPEQREAAEASKQRLAESGSCARPIVTEILPAARLCPAEEYHQQYSEKHGLSSCAQGGGSSSRICAVEPKE